MSRSRFGRERCKARFSSELPSCKKLSFLPMQISSGSFFSRPLLMAVCRLLLVKGLVLAYRGEQVHFEGGWKKKMCISFWQSKFFCTIYCRVKEQISLETEVSKEHHLPFLRWFFLLQSFVPCTFIAIPSHSTNEQEGIDEQVGEEFNNFKGQSHGNAQVETHGTAQSRYELGTKDALNVWQIAFVDMYSHVIFLQGKQEIPLCIARSRSGSKLRLSLSLRRFPAQFLHTCRSHECHPKQISLEKAIKQCVTSKFSAGQTLSDVVDR